MSPKAVIQILLATLFVQIYVIQADHCNSDQFRCKNGKCILQTKLCDGRLDCVDNSDEMDCDLKMCNKPDWFQCALPIGTCLSSDLICNGIENCPGGEDEFDCVKGEHGGSSADFGIGGWHSSQRSCNKYEYTCKSDHFCIPLNLICDGKSDCRDGSDEMSGCVIAKANCTGFLCQNKFCLKSKNWLCDGVDDCGDGSDEINCVNICIPEMGKFLCQNNITCLPLEKACDGVKDCPDETDESIHCTASNDCKNITCPPASKCQMMPQTGPECICPKGFRHSLNDDVCVDINECVEQYGACSQTCVNIPGTYICTCDKGYMLTEDEITCEAAGEEPLLLYTTDVAVMGLNLRSKRVYTIAKNLKKVIGVSYDGDHVYWTSILNEGESIVKANPNGSQPEILLTSGLDAPEDLAVDWLTGNIYFSDNVMHHIAVCSNNGHICTVLVTEDVHQPRGVALWPERSHMFWTDWGRNPMIARASMDGSKTMRLVTENIHWPNGIALDMYNDRIYWVDAKMGTIESVRSNGTYRRRVLEEILKHPYGLAIFEDQIYWSDWATKSVHSCNKFTGKDHNVIVKDRTIYAVHIYHSSKQKKIVHACEESRCSHLCLLAENNSFSCACPDGMILGPDQLRCIKTRQKQLLFLGVRENLLEVEHTKFGRHSIIKTHKLNMIVSELAYNSVNHSVFVVDNFHRVIGEVNLRSSTVKTLVKRNLGNVTALAFDHLSYNLYWSDSERHVVEVYSLQTKQRAVVSFFSGLEIPIGLALVPEYGKMFIALKSRRHVHIDQTSLNGLGKHSHVFEDELGDDYIKFTSDFETETLYWSDSDLGRISYSNHQDLHAYTFLSRLKRPYSIAIIDEDLFWSELRSNTIHWTHKNNMGSLKRFDIEVNGELYITHVLPTHISLTGSTVKPVADHPCHHWNGGCSHVCVTLGKLKAGCLCPAGLLFKDAANRTCIEALDCEFRCRSGECLTLPHKCNNRIDCPDGSDEKNCDAKSSRKPKLVCPVDNFMCHNAEQCLKAEQHCDGRKQCNDGSDEDHCEHFNKTKNCHHHQHVCDNGYCVDYSVTCDGFDDCGDNSDEENCKLTADTDDSSRPVCTKDMFQCTSGTCIANTWECDGKIDCPDASDEHDKCRIMDCPTDMHKCFLGQCIDRQFVCDGNNDCGDFSDEQNCDMLTSSGERKISCGDKQNPMYECPSMPNICLPLSAKCNGTAECARGEDETDCDGLCKMYEFQCKTSKECIRNEFRCDNENDCADGTDEENCETHGAWNASAVLKTHEKPCGPKMWDCRDGECVDETRVCDGIEDCDTGADEGQLCKTACEPVGRKTPCDNKCKATPAGAVCSCFSGYKLDSDHRSCLDINECEELDPCAQICENTYGSYRCSCYPNFMMRPDKTTCKSIESKKTILFSTYDEVRSMTEQPVILKVAWKTNDTKITCFDLNIRTRKAYFTTENANILYMIDVDTGNVISALEVPMPDEVAVDWITDNVYVKSRSDVHEILVCSFSAKMCSTILKVKPHELIQALTVDAYNRRLFIVVVQVQAYGAHRSRIVSAQLDGSKREILLTKERSFITTLACDPYKKMLYYTDMHQKNLQGISYRLGARGAPAVIIQKGNVITYPSGLTWYENEVFIVNLGAKEAIRCQLFGEKNCNYFNLNILNAQSILIDGASRQPMNRNPCDMAKCQGICIQSEFSYECMCGSSIVSETKYCDVSNEITASALLIKRQSPSNESKGSSYVKAVVWLLVILLILIACAIGYFCYRRKRQGQRNFITSMHFQNPLASSIPQCSSRTITRNSRSRPARTDNPSDPFAALFRTEGRKLHIGTSIQRLLHRSTSLHDSEILLENAEPHKSLEMNQQQQRPEPLLFAEDFEHHSKQTTPNTDDNARTGIEPLVYC